MSELKCPACTTVLSEPLPERCPTCQLEGLNKMFLTLEDNKNWKKTVLNEHIKKLRNHKIFVGEAHVLLLCDDGRLFQVIEDKNEKMEIVARNVISATAGYNYSLYLDTEGKVHFIGNSGIAFKERFNQGDLAFKKIFARQDVDVFGAEDIDGNFYVWGDNHNCRLEKWNKTFLITLNTVSTSLINKTYLKLSKYETYGSKWIVRWYSHSDDYSPAFCELESSIKTTTEYEAFRKIHGEENLEIDFTVLSKGATIASGKDKDYDRECTNSAYYDNNLPLVAIAYGNIYQSTLTYSKWEEISISLCSNLYLTNKYIFAPLKSDSKTCDKLFNRKEILIYKERLGSYGYWEYPGAEQGEYYVEITTWAKIYMEENNTLRIVREYEDGDKIYLIENVESCFVWNQTAYVVESSGRVLKGNIKNLLEDDLKKFDEVVFNFCD